MDVIMLCYARPEYMRLTLNSLLYNSSSKHRVHLVINKSDQNQKEINIINEIALSYPGRITTAMIFDDNYIQHGTNVMYQYLKETKQLGDIICCTEDDIIVPSFFIEKYGCFLDLLEETVRNNKSPLAGVHADGFNSEEAAQRGALIERNVNAQKSSEKLIPYIGIGWFYLTMKTSLFEEAVQRSKCIPRDIVYHSIAKEKATPHLMVIRDPIYHLGWNRRMDYPAFFQLLVSQRLQENFNQLDKTPLRTPTISQLYSNGVWTSPTKQYNWTWI